MRRGFWFAAGAGAGVYAMNRARRLRESLTIEGLRDRGRALALGARLAREEAEQGRTEKETELRERMGLAPLPAHRELTAPDRPATAPSDPAALSAATTPTIRTTRQRGSH